ncbi:sialate O-acetylesterase [Sphingobacterium sp. ML3W]|uniref:sialate O-acetylesterase n=1 Tax=Sphingobacterium sp. ML3W TaxID=1538644 RepID=UPI002499D862|nr:sialate O-acetylesterase [Sphingobacterium sp. ML3W]WFA80301.1 sialate O-acetylesterase [Sphingobacterium sp. ML3W]
MNKLLFFLVLCFFVFSSRADVRLPSILASNMVLQQQSTTALWGWGKPREKIKITTSWNNKTVEVTVDGNANWQIPVQTPKAGGPYTIVFEAENKIVLENVFIGEVWVCSGQSNMEWNYYNGITSIKDEFSRLDKFNIKLFQVAKATSKAPQDNNEGNWMVCDSNTLKNFSAVAYYFGKVLNRELNVPIGLISSNWGGTPAEVWIPGELIESNTILKDAAEKKKPSSGWPIAPGYAYNAMIAPLINFNVAGVIWYQGESNVETASSYTQLMDIMIGSWRRAWNKNFPFYYVQIAPNRYRNYNVGALLREAQAKNLSTEKTGMVVVSDLVTDTLNIHPSNKKDVGLRLANYALAETYGLNIGSYKSPMIKSFDVRGNQVVLDFYNADEGLMVKGKKLNETFIAGADKIFYPATVEIKGKQMIVSNKEVKNPVAVRYQFSNTGIGNIFSKKGLPMAPFRTDEWPVDTSKTK